MTKKGIAGQGAEDVHQAKRPQAPTAAETGPKPGPTPAYRFARQSDQSPPPSLDQPWDNLHPERIWPD
ncbi:MAG: hypothetical protein DI596_01865 [Azospira oryzae]|nr:MAG: hypothetical protein DI596_01865 [Azospira oryzae]PZP82448.1 MAG: hypothetical protein DI593_01865 [Azospira oryzae]